MSASQSIYGVGTDVCEIKRIHASLQRHGLRFAHRILTAKEMEVFLARQARRPERGVSYLATRFSAKEAFSKAIGLGMRSPMGWHSCEILNVATGEPVLRVCAPLKAWFEARGLSAKVSLSDEREYAVSFVVVEQSR